jgi:uncharacterized protein YbjQ (UPF0145 family)
MKTKTVSVAVVKTRHIYADLFQWFRNALGMNLVSYEVMIEEATQEAIDKLEKRYPDVFNIRLSTSQVTMGAAEIIAYGEILVSEVV